MKAFSALASYRSEYRFSTWLYKIAANSSIDFLRKKRIQALSLDRPLETQGWHGRDRSSGLFLSSGTGSGTEGTELFD